MGKAITWEGLVNDKNYTFAYEKIKGKHTITVNGEPIQVKSGFMSYMIGFDEPFVFDNVPARLVIEKNQPDVVVDGVYMQSGKFYSSRPGWVLVFAILCMLIPIVNLGGALWFLLGFGASAICIAIAKTSVATALRVILCIIITIAAWFLYFVAVVGMAYAGLLG